MIELTTEVRLDVADLLVRYATGIDRRDWETFRTCFTADCDVDYGTIGAWQGVDALTAWMQEIHGPCGHTLHRISNVAITAEVDHLAVRSYVDALVLFDDNRSGTRAAGTYDDEVVATPDGLRIARRRFTTALLQMVPDGSILEL